MTTNTLDLPLQSTYGAFELKEFIKRNTLKAFLITIISFFLLLILYTAYQLYTKSLVKELKTAPPLSKMVLEPPPASEESEEQAPPPSQQQIINYGTEARAGTPIPVPDAELPQDLAEFADIKDIQKSLQQTGNVDITQAPDITLDDKPKEYSKPVDEIPPDDTFIPVEKEPYVDLAELQKKVIYPEMARRAGIEGRVIIRVYVDKTGKPVKYKIEATDSQMLNQAAIDAVMKTTFTPAIQNGQPIGCWVTIPIQFKLKN